VSDLFAPLTGEQLILIRTIAGSFLTEGSWPAWRRVERTLDRDDLDARNILQSLPMIGQLRSIAPNYGAAWYDQYNLSDESPIRLTIAASLHLPDFRVAVGEPFIVVLNALIERYKVALAGEIDAPDIVISSDELAATLPHVKRSLLSHMPEIFRHEPMHLIGYLWGVPGSEEQWSITLERQLLKYKGVHRIEEYVRRATELVVEANAEYAAFVGPTLSAPSEGDTGTRVYVRAELLDALESKRSQSTWNLDKLISLLRELDDNFGRRNPYACHALLRAVLDHIPPVFGRRKFAEVVANEPWGQTDKKYIQLLERFKGQGHDVLHRQIGTAADLIEMDDLPPRPWLNTLLQAVVNKL
jgi:hypothetical protein